MRFTASGALALSVALLGLGVLGACGGGGGGDGGSVEEPPPPSLFSGNFGLTGFQGRTDAGLIHESRWGALGSDGAGAFSCDYSYNLDASVHTASVSHGYEIGLGRRLAFSNAFGEYAIGRVAETGRLCALSWIVAGSSPGVLLNLQRGLNQTEADLAGNYRGCFVGFSTGVAKPQSGAGIYGFDGAGVWNGTWHANIDGMIFGPQTAPPGTYAVTEPGAVSFSFSNGFNLRGQLQRGGAVLSLAGGTVSGDDLSWYCFVRESAGLDDAALDGTYALVGIYYDFDVGSLNWVGVGGSWTGDGAGGYTATFQENEATSIRGPVTESGSYSVGDTGRLIVTKSDGQVFEGGVTADGSFAAYGGGTSDGARPGIFLLVR